MGPFHVDSEIGPLRKVMLHAPDLELTRLTPGNVEDLLFDEILWVERARAEHAAFAGVLRSHGVEVYELADLLAEALAEEATRKELLDRVVTVDAFGAGLAPELRAWFDSLAARELVSYLIGGVIPEDLLFAAVEFPVWYGGDGLDHYPAVVEGGDVLVIGNRTLLVGMGERTTPQGVEALARRMFAAGALDAVVAVELPKVRAYMHLDTVLTQVDRDAFVVYPGLRQRLRPFLVTPGRG